MLWRSLGSQERGERSRARAGAAVAAAADLEALVAQEELMQLERWTRLLLGKEMRALVHHIHRKP